LFPGAVLARSQDLLRGAIQVLARVPGTTFLDMPRFLLDDDFRRRILVAIEPDVILAPQWAAFDSLSKAEQANQTAAPANKLRALLSFLALRVVLGVSGGLDVEAMFASGGIILASTSKGTIGTDASALLGALILTRAWDALGTRAALPPSARRPVLLVLDEVGDYLKASSSLGALLAQARALNVGVVISHQLTAQLPAELRQDLRTNARSKVVFQLSSGEAKLMADEFAPYLTASDLMGLGRHEIAYQACVDGEVLPPATGLTLPPPASLGSRAEVLRLSAERFGRPRAEVEREIQQRHSVPRRSGSVGHRRRP
jgi:hypothetical protein